MRIGSAASITDTNIEIELFEYDRNGAEIELTTVCIPLDDLKKKLGMISEAETDNYLEWVNKEGSNGQN
jgi:hypothetical protein